MVTQNCFFSYMDGYSVVVVVAFVVLLYLPVLYSEIVVDLKKTLILENHFGIVKKQPIRYVKTRTMNDLYGTTGTVN
jgi:hypothetical protein